MNSRFYAITAVCLAVIACSVAAVMVSLKRSETAHANQLAAASAEAAAEAEKRAAVKTAEAESARERTAKAQLQKSQYEEKTAQENRLQEEAAKKTASHQAEEAKSRAEEARMQAEAARARADESKALADAARAKADEARATAQAEEAKAEAQESLLAMEKLKAERAIAEAKIAEDRRIDYETLYQQLYQLQQELEEEKRALTPDPTVAELSRAGDGGDCVVDEHGDLTNVVKVVYNPETDRRLPPETRLLAKANRARRELSAQQADAMRQQTLDVLVALYERAVAQGRVVDAEFFRKNIKSLYPDWEHGK